MMVQDTGPSEGAWSEDGYVTEIPYMRGFIRYQSPLAISFAAAVNAIPAPDISGPFTYCDLGCGEAVTLMALATAYPQGRFVGVDLNAEHIENARGLAKAAGLDNVTFLCATFNDFAAQTAQGFDFIAAHGVYSWVGADVAASLNAAAARCLNRGGLYYFCHYVRPGGARTEALFKLIQAYIAAERGSLSARAVAAVKRARADLAQNPALARQYPELGEEVERLAGRDLRYLVHEFGNRHFRPGYFSDVAQELAAFGLHYAGSSRPERYRTSDILDEGQDDLIAGLPLLEAEIRASLLSDEEFRWDVFYKPGGPRRPAGIEGYVLDSAVFPYRYPKRITPWGRPLSFDTPLFRTLLNHAHAGNRTIGEILAHEDLAGFDADQIRQTVLDMIASRLFQPLAGRALSPLARGATRYRLSRPFPRAAFERDFRSEGSLCFPSQSMGSALVFGGFQALASACMDGRRVEDALSEARARAEALAEAGRRQARMPAAAGDSYFEKQAARFKTRTLPMLMKYGILSPAAS